MAVERQPPFDWEKKGFQDAAIALSVVDYQLRTGDLPSAFVSADSVYGMGALETFAARLGVHQLFYFPNVGALDEAFLKFLKQSLVDHWRKDEEKLKTALEEMSDPLVEALHGLQFTDYDLGIVGTVVGSPRVESLAITKTSTPPPWDRKTGEAITVSFDADVTLEITVESFPFPTPVALRIGDQSSNQQPPMAPLRSHQSEQEFKLPVSFKATTIFDGLAYTQIQVNSVSPIQQRGLLSMMQSPLLRGLTI